MRNMGLGLMSDRFGQRFFDRPTAFQARKKGRGGHALSFGPLSGGESVSLIGNDNLGLNRSCRSSQGLCNRPASFQTTRYYAWFPSELSCPLRDSFSFSLVLQDMIFPRVVGLLPHASDPYAIFRRIAQVIILALNGVLRTRAWSHIREKVRKRMHPPGGHFYASPPIVGVCSSTRVHRAGFYVTPDSVFRSHFSVAVGHSMCSRALAKQVYGQASATSLSIFQICLSHDFKYSAFAKTEKPTKTFLRQYLSKDCQAVTGLSDLDRWGSVWLSHCKLSPYGGQGRLNAYDVRRPVSQYPTQVQTVSKAAGWVT